MRKTPVKFTFNNQTIVAPVNHCVPGKGYVTVLAISPCLVDENTDSPAIRIYVECNMRSTEPGRQYALFYNTKTKQFDGNYTVN